MLSRVALLTESFSVLTEKPEIWPKAVAQVLAWDFSVYHRHNNLTLLLFPRFFSACRFASES